MKPCLFLLFLLCLLPACTADLETAAPSPAPSTPLPAGEWWRPAPGLRWQIQFDADVDTSVDAEVFDIDLDVDRSIVDDLHARGRKVICYISVGSWEEWRADADQYPAEVLGNDYEGWPGEQWLDIRRIDLLAPILLARFDHCAAAGFDAVEIDNIEIYDQETGFPLTYTDQLTYALWLADEAHSRGLAIGLKNAPDMVDDALASFDFAIIEDAYYFGWASAFLPFVEAGKPVFAIEYTDMDVDFAAACAWGSDRGFSFILKDRLLGAFRETCP